MSDSIQQLAESVLINAMNGGELSGMVFRHSDNALKSQKTSISVKAGAPVRELEGPRPFRVEVEINIKTDKPNLSASFHGVVMKRILDVAIVRNAALSAGMTEDHDLYILDDEIGGDRQETSNLRKRTITVPLLINTDELPTPVPPTVTPEEQPASLVLTQQPGTGQVGFPLNTQPIVVAKDGNGDDMPDWEGDIYVSLASGSGVLLSDSLDEFSSGVFVLQASAGVAAFPDLECDPEGTYTLLFETALGGDVSVESEAFEVVSP